jgi:hypothetical protein
MSHLPPWLVLLSAGPMLVLSGCKREPPPSQHFSRISGFANTSMNAPPTSRADSRSVRDTVLRGHYLRETDLSAFRPCGSTEYLRIEGRREAVVLLQEHWRFTTGAPGRPLFAIMRGHVVRDSAMADSVSATGQADATAKVSKSQRFFLTRMDSLRASLPGDCRGDRS